jgi:hypothetical protein
VLLSSSHVGGSHGKCKCGLAWVLTQHDVDVSYRGLIRCVCERPLINWDGPFFYTVERAKDPLYVPSDVAGSLSPVSPEVAQGAVSL